MAKQNLQCPYCPKRSSRGTGLASHIRGAHPAEYAEWSMKRKSGQTATSRRASKGGLGSGLKDIIVELERQSATIDRALSALRAVEGL